MLLLVTILGLHCDEHCVQMHLMDFSSCLSVQILEVNGQNFENVQLTKANEILRNNTHLSITVKTNLLGETSKRHDGSCNTKCVNETNSRVTLDTLVNTL